MRIFLLTIIITTLFVSNIKSQHLNHDLGLFLGSTSLQTDYGERGDFASQWKNNGLSFSIAHYLNFYNNSTRWDPNDFWLNHIALKTELQYISNTELAHEGKWVKRNSDAALRLRSMTGSVSMLNLGVNLEYHLKPLEEFVHPYSDIFMNPFLSLGFRYSMYNNQLNSTLGDWRQDISVLPQKYRLDNALSIGKGNALSLQFGAGSRFKISEKLDLVTQFNYQVFFTDTVDGLQAPVDENKNYEWLLNIQFGLVYHLNFNNPLFY